MGWRKLNVVLALQLLSCLYWGGVVVEGQLDHICVAVGNLELVQGLYSGESGEKGKKPNINFCTQLEKSNKAPGPGGSIGASKYRLKSGEAQKMMGVDGVILGGGGLGCMVREAADPSTIQVNAVKTPERYLDGWLSFGINIERHVHWAFIQVSDEDGNAIGEFVKEGVKQICGDTFGEDVIFGSPRQFLPCSAVGPQEARVSEAVVYADSKSLNKPASGSISNFLESPKGSHLKMRFLWRLNEYYCNRHEKFRMVAYYLAAGSDVSPTFIQGDWLYPKWFGVADLLPQGVKLECLSPLDEAVSSGQFWIEKQEPSTEDNDNFEGETEGSDLPNSLYTSCRTYLTRLDKYRSEATKQPSFGGRCQTKKDKKFKPGHGYAKDNDRSSVDIPHDCQKNSKATYPSTMEKYEDYLAKRQKQYEKVCNEKTTKCPDLKGMNAKLRKNRTAQRKEIMVRYATGRYIGRTRAYHGLTMSWAFLFFIPISNFIARYFKETFLDWDVMGLRLWSVLHMGTGLWAVAMIATALSASGKVRNVYGYSHDSVAQQHVIMGWVCVVLFGLTIVLGPFRPVKPKIRSVIMVAHAILGFSHYFVGLWLIVSSTVIPGSPSATICYRDAPTGISSFSAPFQHKNSTMVVVWICLDLFFHFVMTRLQTLADRAWNIQRQMLFPMVPVVKLEDTRSFKFFRYRAFVLILYVGVLLIFVGVMWGRLYGTNFRSCDAGPMTCTHENNNGSSQYPEIICGRIAEIRAMRKKMGLD